jgi:redox-sensitive bicupin YhaK (pirin superfamily)
MNRERARMGQTRGSARGAETVVSHLAGPPTWTARAPRILHSEARNVLSLGLTARSLVPNEEETLPTFLELRLAPKRRSALPTSQRVTGSLVVVQGVVDVDVDGTLEQLTRGDTLLFENARVILCENVSEQTAWMYLYTSLE